MYDPNVPMTPDEIPQQRLYAVSHLPPRPDGFEGDCVFYGGVPEELARASHPRKADFLFSAEWAWSPMHNRIHAYYFNPRRRWWLLWARYFDDNELPWRWRWFLYGVARRLPGVDDRTAAIHLMIDAWRNEDGLDRYHWIDETGAFSVGDVAAIEEAVWPETPPED